MITLKKLDEWMEREGLMDADIARFLGVTRACVCKWRSRGKISRRQIFKLKHIYGTGGKELKMLLSLLSNE